MRIAILADGPSRMEMPDGNYTVMDMKAGKAICVSQREKKATIMLGLYVPSGMNAYEMVRNAVTEKSKRLPDEVLDGRKVNVFRVEWNEQVRKEARGPCEPMKVWVDPQTKLPIRMEPMQQDAKAPVVMYDFVFDQPLDPSLFSLDPPKDYTVTTMGRRRPGNRSRLPQGLARPRSHSGRGTRAGKVRHVERRSHQAARQAGRGGKRDIEYPSRGYGLSVSPQNADSCRLAFSRNRSAPLRSAISPARPRKESASGRA